MRLSKIFKHSTQIEHLDVSQNKINDKWGFYFKKMISRQSERRNNILWLHNLRGENPENDSYKSGLISLAFDNTFISDSFLNYILESLLFDSYICSLSAQNNCLSFSSLASFFSSLKLNNSLIFLDFK